jgi:uncharacterized delta-60 repeat protein
MSVSWESISNIKKIFFHKYLAGLLAIILVAAGFANTPITVRAADGNYDATFSSGGTGVNGEVLGTDRQPDGKVLIVGNFTSYNGTPVSSIARLNADGSLDTSFNVGSGPEPLYAGQTDKILRDVKVLPGGDIIVVGDFTDWCFVSNAYCVLWRGVVRLKPDGTVRDAEFNATNSALIMHATSLGGAAHNITIAGNYYYLTGPYSNAGSTSLQGVPTNVYDGSEVRGLLRVKISDNSIDTSLKNPNYFLAQSITPCVGASNNLKYPVISLPNGQFILRSNTNRLVKCNSNGSMDTSFVTPTLASSFINEMALQPDGKIVVVGTFPSWNGDTTIRKMVRLNANGSVDTTFNTARIYPNLDIYTVGLQNDGKILLGGNFFSFNTTPSTTFRTKIARLNADGSMDTGYDSSQSFNSAGYYVNDILIQPDGNALVAGKFATYVNSPYVVNSTVYPAGGIVRVEGFVSYTITYTAGPGGTIFGDLVQTVPYNGTGTQVVAQASPGYTFTGWSDDPTQAFFGNGRYEQNVSQNINVTANFELIRNINFSPANIDVNEGSTNTATVVLEGQPTANVTLTLTSGDTSAVTVSPSSVTFTPANYATPQTVTVTGVQDANYLTENVDITATVATGTDTGWNSVASKALPVQTLDDEVPPTFGTSNTTITGELNSAFPTIVLTGSNIPNGTDAWFVQGTQAQVNGKMQGGNFVPNAGSKIPLSFTVGPSTGNLYSNGVAGISVNTDFTLPSLATPTLNFPAVLHYNNSYTNFPYSATGTCDSNIANAIEFLIDGGAANFGNIPCISGAFTAEFFTNPYENNTNHTISVTSKNNSLSITSPSASKDFYVDFLTNIILNSPTEFAGTPTFTGACEAAGTINFWIDGNTGSPDFSTGCLLDGTFTVSPNINVSYYQPHSLKAVITDIYGNTDSVNSSFTIKHPVPTITEINTQTVDTINLTQVDSVNVIFKGKAFPGDTIALGGNGDNSVYDFVFDCTDNFPNNISNCSNQVTTLADTNGDWTYTYNFTGKFNGPNNYRMQVASFAPTGNMSTDYAVYNFEITSLAFPTKPTISTPLPAVLANPVFSGSCDAGTNIAVVIYTYSITLPDVVCGAGGTYSTIYNGSLLVDQYYQIIATSTNPATGAKTDSDYFNFDTIVPKIGTSALPISGRVGNIFPDIRIIGTTLTAGTVVNFVPTGSATTITGKIRNGNFIPDAGQLIASDVVVGTSNGALSSAGLPNLNVVTNFINTAPATPAQLTVTINQASAQIDPATSGPVKFTVVFSQAIDATSFTTSDVVLTGSAPGASVTSVTQIAPNDGTTFEVQATATGDGTIVAGIPVSGFTFTTAGFASLFGFPSGTLPNAMVKDSLGNFYVMSTTSKTIHKITSAGAVGYFGTTSTTPNALAIDSANNLYTANSDGSIRKITSTGYASALGTAGTNPSDLVVDASGNVYVSNFGSNNISKITPTGTASVFATVGTGPTAIKFDGAGNLYTSNSGSNTVSKITSGGSVSTLGTTGAYPTALAIDVSGNVYTANRTSNNVTKITSGGSSTILGTTGTNPAGIGVDTNGNVYTTNKTTNNVSRITQAGVSSIVGSTGTAPTGILVDTDGKIYTTNSAAGTIQRLTPTFATGVKTSTGTGNKASTSTDNSVTITSNSANIVVTETGSSTTEPELGTDMFGVRLSQAPTTNVVVNVVSSNTSAATASPSTLTFTPANWNTDQTVTVTGVKDANAITDSSTITMSIVVASSDALYATTSNKVVNNTTTDLDSAGYSVTPVIDQTLGEGVTKANTFLVVLTAQPTSNVVMDISTLSSALTLNTTSLTFTPANWNVAQNVSITGAEDNTNVVSEQDQVVTFAINAAGSDDTFDVVGSQTRQIDVIDNDFTLTYTAGSNGSLTGTTSQVVGSGASGTVVTAVPNMGYSFVNWSDNSTQNPRTDTNVTANKSVTANFAINTFSLAYTAGSNGTITGTTSQTVNYGANGTSVTAVPNANYRFVNWSDGITTATRTDTNIIANKSVTANFTIDTFTLAYIAGSNGTIVGTSPQIVNYGSNGSAVTATANVGYVFSNWSDGITTATRTDTNITANKSVTANFSPAPFSATINQAAGQVDPSLATNLSFTVVFGTAITPSTFDVSDITLSGTGAGTVGTPTTTDNITWNVPVTGITPGTIIATIGANKVTGAILGNTNNASTSTDNTITYGPDTTAPTITLDTFVSPTRDNTPTFTGTLSDNIAISSVTVTIDGTDFSATFASGTWSFTTNTLTDGTYTIKAKATDTATNTASTTQQNFVVDTTAPTVPTVNLLSTNDNTPTLTGSCEFQSDIEVDVNNVSYQTTCAFNGTWSKTLPVTPDGTYSVGVSSTDPAGNISVDTTSNELTINTAAPVLAEVTPVSTPGSDNTPNYTFSSTKVGTTTYAGDCSSTTSAAITGNNTVTFNTLADGTHSNCTIKVTDSFGNQSNVLSLTPFVIDTQAPASPTISVPALTSDNTPDITGTCEGNAVLSITVSPTNQVIPATCSATGTYTVTPTIIPDGNYSATVKQTDRAGNQSPTATASGVIDNTAPVAPVITSPTPGTSLNVSIVNIVGTGEANAQITVKDENSNTICSATVSATGAWNCTTIALADGPHSISATQRDGAGNISVASTNITINTNDGDGVTPAIEDGAPNSGDGNNDGIADKLQSNVASILNSVNLKYTTLVTNGSCNQISSIAASASQADLDPTLKFPAGLVDFSTACTTNGGSANVELIFMGDYDLATAKLQKLSGSTLKELTGVTKALVVIGGQNGIKFSYTIVDGGANDQDGLANGVVVDPIGMSLPVATQAVTPPSSNPMVEIPTQAVQTLIRTGGQIASAPYLVWILLGLGGLTSLIVGVKKRR